MRAHRPGARQRPATTRTVLEERDGDNVVSVVRRTVLPGGLRIVTESMPHVRSATFGVWVGVGSRDEAPTLAGSSHYLEHLLFKGTKRRTALDISAAIDAVGGEMNAFTSKEYTCFYARVLDRDLPLAIDVICDMITSAVISGAEVDNERGVILEELAMHEDDPSDSVHDLFASSLWGDAPLGRPILGSVDSIRSLSRTQIAGYYRRRYRPHAMVVAAAGNVDHKAVVADVRAALARADRPDFDEQVAPSAARVGGVPPAAHSGVRVHHRGTEQANLVLGVPGIIRTDDRRFALGALNAALGGGMSSRLFQEVREKRGLAYSVYSFVTSYADAGYLGVYAGCQPDNANQVIEICRNELATVVEKGLTDEELDRAKGQLRGSMVLGMEDSGSRMSRLGKSELVYGELLSLDDILARIDAVTLDDIQTVARAVLDDSGPMLTVVGPFDDPDHFKAALS